MGTGVQAFQPPTGLAGGSDWMAARRDGDCSDCPAPEGWGSAGFRQGSARRAGAGSVKGRGSAGTAGGRHSILTSLRVFWFGGSGGANVTPWGYDTCEGGPQPPPRPRDSNHVPPLKFFQFSKPPSSGVLRNHPSSATTATRQAALTRHPTISTAARGGKSGRLVQGLSCGGVWLTGSKCSSETTTAIVAHTREEELHAETRSHVEEGRSILTCAYARGHGCRLGRFDRAAAGQGIQLQSPGRAFG